MLFFRYEFQLNLSVGRKDIVRAGVQPDDGTVGVACVGFGVAVRKEPRPRDGFAFGRPTSGSSLKGREIFNDLIFHNASDSLLESANVAAHWEIRCKGRGKLLIMRIFWKGFLVGSCPFLWFLMGS